MSITTRSSRLWALVAAAALALVGTATNVPTAAARSAADSCLAAGEVYLVVVKDSGSVMYRGCVGNPGSGYGALNASGLGYTNAPPPRGYVCTIGGYPTCPDDFDGQYWSYWRASPGGSYSYSAVGADAAVKPGAIYGWCYTPSGGQDAQQSSCQSKLTAALNPATASATVTPTVAPTTAAPTSKPTTRPTTKPTTGASTARPNSARPTSAAPAKPAATNGSPTTTTGPNAGAPTGTKATSPGASSSPSRGASAGSATPSSSAGSPSASATGSGSPTPGGAASASAGPDNGSTVARDTSDKADPALSTGVDPTDGPEQGSATGLLVTGAVLVVAAGATGGWLYRKRRHG